MDFLDSLGDILGKAMNSSTKEEQQSLLQLV
jgi:hypothetical protein